MWCMHLLLILATAYRSLGSTLLPHESEYDRLLANATLGWDVKPYIVTDVVNTAALPAGSGPAQSLTMRVHFHPRSSTGYADLDKMLIEGDDSALGMARNYLGQALHVRVPPTCYQAPNCRCADFDKQGLECGNVSVLDDFVCRGDTDWIHS